MKNFFESKNEKITEKAFSQGLVISIISILLCLIVLCSMTYAWFSEDVSSNENQLSAGHFSVDVVSVLPMDGNEASGANAEAILPNALGIYTLEAGTYQIILQPTEETTVKGYCVITVSEREYHTEVIVNESTVTEAYPTANAPFTFYMTVTEASTVKIESRWGIPSDPVVANHGTIGAQEENTN